MIKNRNFEKITAVCLSAMMLTGCSLSLPFPFSLIWDEKIELGEDDDEYDEYNYDYDEDEYNSDYDPWYENDNLEDDEKMNAEANTIMVNDTTIYYDIIDDTAFILRCEPGDEPFSLEDTLGEYPISGVGARAFDGVPLEYIRFSGISAGSIEKEAFRYCYSLRAVAFNNVNMSIGKDAFTASDVQVLTGENSVLELEDYAFSGTKSLTDFSFSNCTLTMGKDVFMSEANPNFVLENCLLKGIDYSFSGLSASLAIFKNCSFEGCEKAFGCCNSEVISFLNCDADFGGYAFSGAKNLQCLVLSGNFGLDAYAFYGMNDDVIISVEDMTYDGPEDLFDKGVRYILYGPSDNPMMKYVNDSNIQWQDSSADSSNIE